MLDGAAKRIEKRTRVKPGLVRDFRKILDDKEVDAIVNATPDHWHALITVLALQEGKHVYLERPASYNIGDGKALVWIWDITSTQTCANTLASPIIFDIRAYSLG